MTAKKKSKTEAAIKPKETIEVALCKGETEEEATARKLTRPETGAAITIQQWQGGVCTVTALAKTLAVQVDDIKNGNMERPEAMLLSQAHTLDELFNTLARKAFIQDHLKNYDAFLRLALKAQSQCRSTLETLAAIKNPPVIFAKQANISNGHQQINNGIPAPATYAEEIKNQQNELLENTHGERLDGRTKSEAIGVNTELAALG